MKLKFTAPVFIFILQIVLGNVAIAQQPVAIPTPSDTIRIIQIIQSKNLRQKVIDSATTIETAAGNVIIKEGKTTTYCDSVIINHHTNIVEAFGNVHINDNDSIHTYAQYMRYIGTERIAYLKRGVKLTDKKGTLFTEDLDYNLRTGIANYRGGGRVVNGKTILTSTDGVYFAETKDVFFKNKVHLKDPKYNITSDSLKYNINRDEVEFIAPTHIISKEGIIDTKSGIYNLKTGQAIFYDRTFFRDSTMSIIGDRIYNDEKTGIVQIDGNAKFVDSTNQVTVIGEHLEVSKKDNSFLAYNKPVMILYKDGDSTYIAADTLFSGIRRFDKEKNSIINKTDTLASTISVNADTALSKEDILPISISDTLSQIRSDSTSAFKTIANRRIKRQEILPSDSTNNKKEDVAIVPKNKNAKKTTVIDLNKQDTVVRYFLAFHHVRIFNDSLQAVSDSLYYATEDSTFQLFGEPVVWNGKTQITGDTIYMYTEKQKAKRLYVFFNSIIINQTAPALFNQIAGRTLNGYFVDGQIDYVRVKGSPAESIFYPQDDDSAYTGMNRSSGDVIDIYFVKKELNKVKFVNNVDGVMYPIRQIPADKKELRNFKWLDAKRPKNKLELFE